MKKLLYITLAVAGGGGVAALLGADLRVLGDLAGLGVLIFSIHEFALRNFPEKDR